MDAEGKANHMIYVTGDTHTEFGRFTKYYRKRLPFRMGEDDFCIVCGDFGLLWEKGGTLDYNLDWLSRLPFRILWVQGNHENYDMIAEYAPEEWNGGRVRHIVRDRIILLERGQVFQIEGKRFFTFGGASSHDIQGGILDRTSPSFKTDRIRAVNRKQPFRILNESWWAAELPGEEEIRESRRNLEQAGYEVDYVITHCASNRMQESMRRYYSGSKPDNGFYGQDVLTDYFEELEEKLSFQKWYFGHYHDDIELDDKHILLYNRIVPLGEAPVH